MGLYRAEMRVGRLFPGDIGELDDNDPFVKGRVEAGFLTKVGDDWQAEEKQEAEEPTEA